MLNHLKTHNISCLKRKFGENEIETIAPSTSKQKSTISEYFKKESLNEILSKCAAMDGFSIKGITSSEAIKGYVKSRNYDMPKSCTSVMKCINNFYEEKKQEMKNALSKQIDDGKRFSITVDEWSDVNLRRFMNIIVHSSESSPFVLGLAHFEGSCGCNRTIGVIKNMLIEFGIDMDLHVVASTQDGCSLMVKYGKSIPALSQLCLNHAIHLAVLYKKRDELLNYDEEQSEIADCDDIVLEISDNSDQENETENNEVDIYDNFIITENDNLLTIRKDIGKILIETRKSIKFFKNSSVRNSILQKHVKEQEGKKLNLLLDCRTRWNSTITMLNRFIKLKSPITKALAELGQPKLKVENLKIIEIILKVLQPVELAIKELSKSDCNLLKAEGICIFLLNNLEKENSDLAKEMFEALKTRLNERRNKDVVSLLLFLQNGVYPSNNSNSHFKYSTKAAIKSLAQELHKRLFPYDSLQHNNDCGDCEDDDTENEDAEDLPQNQSDTYTEMQRTIKAVLAIPKKKFKFFAG